jgi:hypothetical protein
MSSTLYLILAELTILLHFLFVVFVVLGGLVVLRWPKLIYLHLPMLAWGIYIELRSGICPLTPLENHFRHLAGIQPYEGGFINHYLMPILYPHGLTHDTQVLLGVALIMFNILIYGIFVYITRKVIK